MRLLFLGPPGAGKGTQARRVADRLGVPHIASGDLLREHVATGTPLGVEAKRYMDRGDYVPDDLIIELVSQRLDEPDAASGFVLDGFPRTQAQARSLDGYLADHATPLDGVIRLVVPSDVIVERLSGRRLCPTCQRAYHIAYDPPDDDELCDDDGTRLITRPDDEADVVRRRLCVYEEATEGLLAYYEDAGLLVRVDGVGEVEEVAKRVDEALGAGA